MVPSQAPSELALVRAVLAGDAKAAARLIELASSTLWSATVRLAGDGKEGEAAFLHVVTALKADGWRQLRAFDGRSSLATYLALVARDVLADRLAKRFVEAPREAWMRFELFFGEDIRRRILRRFPREARSAAGDDLYQDVCLKLIEDDYRRVRSYDGRGSFSGYILTVVERVLIDLMRRDAPRRRLPAAIARLSALDQEVYAAIAWEKCPPEVERLAAALRGRLESAPDAAALREALARVAEAAGRDAGPVRTETVSLAVGEDGEELEVADSGPRCCSARRSGRALASSRRCGRRRRHCRWTSGFICRSCSRRPIRCRRARSPSRWGRRSRTCIGCDNGRNAGWRISRRGLQKMLEKTLEKTLEKVLEKNEPVRLALRGA